MGRGEGCASLATCLIVDLVWGSVGKWIGAFENSASCCGGKAVCEGMFWIDSAT